jgi:hypothetical protein
MSSLLPVLLPHVLGTTITDLSREEHLSDCMFWQMPLFTQVPRETVWKIAGGLLIGWV